MKKLIAALLFVSVVFGVFANSNVDKVDENGFKRSETLYITGAITKAPENFNPINWGVVPGIRGLVYESLFYYSPLTNELEPWLAQSFEWINDGKTLEIKMTKGAHFNNGEPVTIEDIAYVFSYKAEANPFGADEVDIIDDETIQVTWASPGYHSIIENLYGWPVISKTFWQDIAVSIAGDITITPEESIGTGPYKIESYQQDRIVYIRDDNYWGKEGKGLDFPAKRIVHMKSMANNVVLGLIDQGTIDMANNYIPGLPQAMKKNPNIVSWYDEEPYHLPDSVTYLFPNLQLEPFSDIEFRRALANAIDPVEIADVAFENMVVPRHNVLGLHNIPSWDLYNNEDIVEEYGYEFNRDEAKAILDEAGYKDVDGDGFVEYPDGSPLEVKLAVPTGWTDYMDTARVIADQLSLAGINCTPEFPDVGRWESDMLTGNFDMILNNWNSYLSSSPNNLYQWLGATYAPIGEKDWSGNYGRYDNPEYRDLASEFSLTPIENVEEGNAIVREMQKILLTDIPQIPVVVGGIWFVANNSVWTNWPSEDTQTNRNFPSINNNKFQIGGLRMLEAVELNTGK